jgi:co-chaperonin GroES (HSP10)
MMTDWVFVEPVEQPGKTKSDIIEIIQTEETVNEYGRVWSDSPFLNENGVYKGDIVRFEKNADYSMDVDGKKVWRMMFGHLMFVTDESAIK